MKTVRLNKLAWLVPLLALVAGAAWLRADEPPASPEDKPTPAPAVTPAEPAPAAQETAAAEPEETEHDKAAAAAELARVKADEAVAEAEKAAELARTRADQIRAEAEAAVEKARQLAAKSREDAAALVQQAREENEKAHEEIRSAVEETQKQAAKSKRAKRQRGTNKDDNVVVGADNHIAAETVVAQNAVAVLGNLTVDGEVKGDAVAVMGDNTINNHIGGKVVAVMGNITLGPKAVVDGGLVCVGGEIIRDPAAVVHGEVEVQTFGPGFKVDSITNWWNRGLKLGRPLAIGAHLGWLWIITAFSVAFYALLGLLFPKKITECGDKLITSPGMVLLAAVLAVLAMPVLFVLLCITIIGIPVALLVLPVGTLFVAMFGKAAIYGLVGRKLSGGKLTPVLAVLLGAMLFVLLYLVPFIGLILSLLVWFLGFGCAVLMMFARSPKAAATPVAPIMPAPQPAVAPVAAVSVEPVVGDVTGTMPAQSEGFGATPPPVVEPPPAPGAATFAAAPQPAVSATRVVISADTLPRAGFWIRVAAALLDFIMIVVPLAIIGAMEHGPGPMFLGVAAYSAVMWKLKGTTIGGVICGLKLVRLDDREIDWGVAIVRSLAAFLSFFVVGLGFIWVAFDDEKQSWHDRIAGTTIVRVPKGTPLI